MEIWTIISLLRLVAMAFGTTSAQTMTNPSQDLQRVLKGQPGSWSSWSAWSVCSRSCGGGITVQTRQCRSKPLGRHRRRSNSSESPHHCIGLYKRIRTCNTKECPGTSDFRQEQCSRYDGQQFLGRAYDWEPFLDAPDQCALNCRARGFRFYATLNASVEDGTPCRGFILGHDTDRWVCVAGQCKHVGCDGVVGSDQRYDGCGVCGGDNSTCRLVSGLFTRPQLPVGYNLITQIPQAACNLSITELKQSRNYLALRKIDGTFILNGNWAINWSGEFDSLGTKFFYHREDESTGESIASTGPLAEPVDLMLIYQQPNPGIKYQYHLPVGTTNILPARPTESPLKPSDFPLQPSEKKEQKNIAGTEDNAFRQSSLQTPHANSVLESDLQGYSGDEAAKPKVIKGKKRKFSWKISGLSKCSKSCGGGIQTTLLACVREIDGLKVADRRCAVLERPAVQASRCNIKPCVAQWVVGEWGECSVSCGEGVQRREIVCRQEITPTLTMTVAEGACLTPMSASPRSRTCQGPPCLVPGSQWTVGAWSQCSAQCGQGLQTRSVHCALSGCNVQEKPVTETVCHMPPCPGHKHSHTWLYTEWSKHCSEGCGTGVQERRVFCVSSSCDESTRPEHQRTCSSDKLCGALWLTGSWSHCSSSCGWGRQSRVVVCVVKSQEHQSVTSNDRCGAADKPVTEQQCRQQACAPEWFMSDWSQCSRPCGAGVQRRDVRCLTESQQASTACNETSKPPTRRSCNTHKCPDEQERREVVQSNEGLRDQPRPQDSQTADSITDGSECTDKFRNCHLVVQARLCKYKYYRMSCCQACHNKQL